ncbi:MAG: Na/Pi cotransporter family protein, partial [Clostridia bacterium]|nr:Na/Pi cotransporter family protein [Clostridia bacterium]
MSDYIFLVIRLLGGLAIFLYGMSVMSNSLEKLAGGKIEGVLQKLTSNPFKGLILGAIITIAVQSSSAVTVMLVGLVNSGIMELAQAISITMGSNIGTTVTAWLLSLAGIESDSLVVLLMKPANFSPIVAFIGIMMIMMSKKQSKKDVGAICIGFALLMYGMSFMSDAVKPLAEVPEFTSILTAFSNPVFGVLAGALVTAVIQASAASVGILQALSMTGSITYSAAIPIIMGQNIGTCITAMISSIGAGRNAKRVAVVHLLFNCIGTFVLLTAWTVTNAIVDFAFADKAASPFSIAVIHSIFNVASTVILFPFAKLLEKASRIIVKDKEEEVKDEDKPSFLDDRLLTVPSIAVGNAMSTTKTMAALAENSVLDSLKLLERFNAEKAEEIVNIEGVLDNYEDNLGTYLVKLSKCQLSDKDERDISMLLHVITDLERIGDHAENLVDVSREMHDKEISFSHEARRELATLSEAIEEILKNTISAFVSGDLATARSIEPLEQVIDTLITEIRTRHITRLQKGSCTIELGFVLTDLLTNCERISD